MCLTVLTAGQAEDSVVVFDDGYGTADVTIGFDTAGQLGVSVCVYLDAAGTPDTPPVTDNARPSAISAVQLTGETYNPDRLADAANALLAALDTHP